MARKLHLFGLVATFILSIGAAQKEKEHTHPLFEYETTSLTEESLQRLIDKAGAGASAPLFAFDDGSTEHPSTPKSNCKAFPGDAEWPSQHTWKTFRKLLGGALIETLPIGAPCYKNLGVYDAKKCSEVRDSFADPYFQ